MIRDIPDKFIKQIGGRVISKRFQIYKYTIFRTSSERHMYVQFTSCVYRDVSNIHVPFNCKYSLFLFPFNDLLSFFWYDKCSFTSTILPQRCLNYVWKLVLILTFQIFLEREVFHSLHKMCPLSELFWSVFSRIQTQYGPEKLRIRALFTLWFRWRFYKRRDLEIYRSLNVKPFPKIQKHIEQQEFFFENLTSF